MKGTARVVAGISLTGVLLKRISPRTGVLALLLLYDEMGGTGSWCEHAGLGWCGRLPITVTGPAAHLVATSATTVTPVLNQTSKSRLTC